MKKLLMILLAVASVIVMTGCLSPTQTKITEFDPATGKQVKETTTSESVLKTLTESTKGKLVLINNQSWTGGVYFVPPASDAENAAGVLKAAITKRDFTMLTVPMEAINSATAIGAINGLAGMVAAGRAGDIGITSSGISASAPATTATDTGSAAK